MMVTTRLGYCCAALGAAQARTLSKAVSRRKTYRIGDLSVEFPRSLRLRDHGQQEIRHLAGAEVQGIAAGENGGRAGGRISVREGGGALHRGRGIRQARGGGVIFVILCAPGEGKPVGRQ